MCAIDRRLNDRCQLLSGVMIVAGVTRSDTRRRHQTVPTMTSAMTSSDVPETAGSRSFKVVVTDRRVESDSDHGSPTATKMEPRPRQPDATTTTSTTTTTITTTTTTSRSLRPVSESSSKPRSPQSDDVTATTTTKMERRDDNVTETAGESTRLDVDDVDIPPPSPAAAGRRLVNGGETRSSPVATDEETSPPHDPVGTGRLTARIPDNVEEMLPPADEERLSDPAAGGLGEGKGTSPPTDEETPARHSTVAITGQDNDEAGGPPRLDVDEDIPASSPAAGRLHNETLPPADEEILPPQSTVAGGQDNDEASAPPRLDVDDVVTRSAGARSSGPDVTSTSRSDTRRTTTDDPSWRLALSPNEGR